MNGELANLIALALHGTAWLEESSGPPPDLERKNSTFQYVGSFMAEPPLRRWRPDGELMDGSAWFRWLKKQGVGRLWLTIPARAHGPLAPQISAAFANGGEWALLAIGRRPSIWVPRWEVGDSHAADNRIWRVRLVGSWADGTAPQEPPIDSSLARLTDDLQRAKSLAQEQGLNLWAEWFADAIRLAGAIEPEIPYHPDMAPRPPVTLQASRLFAVMYLTQSSVFRTTMRCATGVTFVDGGSRHASA